MQRETPDSLTPYSCNEKFYTEVKFDEEREEEDGLHSEKKMSQVPFARLAPAVYKQDEVPAATPVPTSEAERVLAAVQAMQDETERAAASVQAMYVRQQDALLKAIQKEFNRNVLAGNPKFTVYCGDFPGRDFLTTGEPAPRQYLYDGLKQFSGVQAFYIERNYRDIEFTLRLPTDKRQDKW